MFSAQTTHERKRNPVYLQRYIDLVSENSVVGYTDEGRNKERR
jgi:hypothetical protein